MNEGKNLKKLRKELGGLELGIFILGILFVILFIINFLSNESMWDAQIEFNYKITNILVDQAKIDYNIVDVLEDQTNLNKGFFYILNQNKMEVNENGYSR